MKKILKSLLVFCFITFVTISVFGGSSGTVVRNFFHSISSSSIATDKNVQINATLGVSKTETATLAGVNLLSNFNQTLNAAANSAAQFNGVQYNTTNSGSPGGITYSGPTIKAGAASAQWSVNDTASNGLNGWTGSVVVTSGTVNNISAGIFGNALATAGTISTFEAGRFGLNLSGSAQITTAAGLHVRANSGVFTTGSAGIVYGLEVEAPGIGTTQWTLAADVGNSYIAGTLSLGKATTPGAQLDILQATASSGLPTAFKLTGAAHTGLDGDDYTSALFDFGQTVTFIQNDRNQFQSVLFNPSIFAFAGASNLTFASNVVINGVPGQGANASILAAIGLQVNGGSASNTDGSAVGVYVGLPGIANGIAGMQATQAITIGQGSGNQVGLGNQTAALVDLIYTSIMPDTVVSAVHTRTVSGVIAGLRISGPPVAGANVTFSAPAYSALIESGLSKFAGGIITKNSTANVSTPPTAAELTAAFGSPSTVQAGFMGTVNDNGAGTAVYDVTSDGTNWWYTLMTKAL